MSKIWINCFHTEQKANNVHPCEAALWSKSTLFVLIFNFSVLKKGISRYQVVKHTRTCMTEWFLLSDVSIYSTAQVVFQNPPPPPPPPPPAPNRWGWFFCPPRIFLIPHSNSHRNRFFFHHVSAEFPPQNHPLTCRTPRWAKVYPGELAMKELWRQNDWQLRIFRSLHGEEIGTFILLMHHSADLPLNKYRNIST